MAKPTIKDVAELAGVGLATVDRVVHGRGGVKPDLIEQVIDAINRLGYGAQAFNAHRKTTHIEVIHLRNEISVFERLNAEFSQIAAVLDKDIALHRTEFADSDVEALVDYIAAPPFPRAGLILLAQDHPSITQAVAKARESGVIVVQLLTRVDPGEENFVGIDNYAAGRTAAMLLSRMQAQKAGSFIVLVHSSAYWLHRERVRGFSDFFAGQGLPQHQFPLICFGFDDDAIMTRVLQAAIREQDEVIGVYNAGAASVAVASVLRRTARKVMWIGHALSDYNAAFLAEGLLDFVIDSAPETLARRAVDLVLQQLGLFDAKPRDGVVPFVIITRENIPENFQRNAIDNC